MPRPSAASAASRIASDSVGCAWRGAGDLGRRRFERHRERRSRRSARSRRGRRCARRRSRRSAARRSAWRSPRCAPPRPPCPSAVNGNLPTRTLAELRARLVLGVADPRHLRLAVDAGGDLAVIERGALRRRRGTRPPRCPLRSPCAPAAAHPRDRRSRARVGDVGREARRRPSTKPFASVATPAASSPRSAESGRRPIAISTWSASSTSLSSPLRTATRTPLASTFSSSKRVPVRISILLRRNSRSTHLRDFLVRAGQRLRRHLDHGHLRAVHARRRTRTRGRRRRRR